MRAESAPGGENKPPEITPQKVQKEWTCAICQVTTTAENVLKSHFQGKKHGAKCEELKASKQAEKNKGSFLNSKGAKPNDDVEVIKAVANTEKKEVASAIEMDCRDTLAVGKGLKCKEPNVAQEHIKPVELAEKNAAAAANQAKDAGPNLDQTEKKTAAAAEIKEMRAESAPGGENKPPEITPQKVQKEWTCAICQVTTTCENNLKSHFQGMRHRDKCKELKASKRAEKNKGSSSSAANKGPNQNETKRQKEKVQVTGTSEQKNVKNTNTGMKQSVLWCSICNVRCPGEIAMASHLSGKKHLSRIQDLLSVGGCANA
uniref:Uncharacterized protein n=1 Tax=Davidia involucrata TaxID=16924 RepID=A0A5B7BGE3_DAVIN